MITNIAPYRESYASGYLKLFLLIPMLASPLAAQQDIFAKHWESRVYSPSSTTTPSTAPTGNADISFSISTSANATKVLPTLYGNNLAAWTKKIVEGSNPAIWEHAYTMRHLRNAEISYLRLPGGAWANAWLWDKNPSHWALKSDLTSNQNYLDGLASWSMTFEEMLRTCDSIGAQPQPIVNMGLARFIDEPNPVEKAASYAASWVRHAKSLGRNIEYWEVGNEDYGKWMVNWEVNGDIINGTKYGDAFNVFADSMKAADPNIKVGAVLFPDFKLAPTGNEVPHWTEDVISKTKDHADFYIVHEYFTWNSSDINLITFDEVLAGRDKIAGQKADLDSLILALAGKPIPVAMTEFNMRAGQKNTTLVSTLFFAEALGEFAQAGYGLVNAWNISNGKSTDDHGMLSRLDYQAVPGMKAAEITAAQAEESTPHPHFFSYYYYQKYFGDALASSSGGDNSTHLYASTFSNGYMGIVLVNEASQDRKVELNLQGVGAHGTMQWHTVDGDSIGTRVIKINGQGPPSGKVYGPRDYEGIPANSLALDSNAKSVLFHAPKYSASFISIPIFGGGSSKLVDKGLTTSEGGMNVAFLNGKVQFSLSQTALVSMSVFDMRGNLVSTKNFGTLSAGPHSTYVGGDGPRLPGGLFLVKIDAGSTHGSTMILNNP